MLALVAWLPVLIKLYWGLATCSVLAALLPVPLPVSVKNAVWASASRGKLWGHRPRVLGRLNDVCVPQSWFLHFYAVGAAANVLVLLTHAASLAHGRPDGAPGQESLVALLLFQIHLLRRLVETAFVMRYPKDAKMHIIAYVFGLSYYLLVPLSLLPDDAFHAAHVLQLLPALRGASLGGLCSAAGAALLFCCTHDVLPHLMGLMVFVNGNLIQCFSHLTLAHLSRSRTTSSDKNFYSIPMGGMFNFVSCPHYLAEIMLYAGLATLMRGQLNALLMLAWVTVNLVLAAKATHRWYHLMFKKYPQDRWALIPGML